MPAQFNPPPAPNSQAMDNAKYAADVVAVSAAFSSFAGWFQPLVAIIASLLSICWLTVQLVDWHFKRKAKP